MADKQTDTRLNDLEQFDAALLQGFELPVRMTATGEEFFIGNLGAQGSDFRMPQSVLDGAAWLTKTADYTIQGSDQGKVIEMNGNNLTLTIPDGLGWANSKGVLILQKGTGLTIAEGGSVTTFSPQTITSVQHSQYRLIKRLTNEYYLIQTGAASGGGGGGSYEGYDETGTRPTGIVVEVGDHDNSNNGTKIEVDDVNGTITLTGTQNGGALIFDDVAETVSVVNGNGFKTGVFNVTGNQFTLNSDVANNLTFVSSALTAPRVVTFPDKTDTVAFLGDTTPQIETTAGATITFDVNREYETDLDLTIDLTGANKGAMAVIRSRAASERTIGGAGTRLMKTGTHVANRLNLYYVFLLKNDEYSVAIQSVSRNFAALEFTTGLLDVISANLWRNTTGGNYPTAYEISTTGYTGDHIFSVSLDDNTLRGCMFGLSTNGTKRAWNDGTDPWDVTVLNTEATGKIRVFRDAVDDNPALTDTVTYFTGNTIEIRVISGNAKLFYANAEVHDFGALTGTLYFHISAYSSGGTNLFIKNPQVEIL